MRVRQVHWVALPFLLVVLGCGNSDGVPSGGTGGGRDSTVGSGVSSGTAGATTKAATGGAPSGTGGQFERGTGGSGQTGGSTAAGGKTGTGGQSGRGTGGSAGGGHSGRGTGGSGQTGGSAGTVSQPDGGLTGSCVPTKTWGTADPSTPGPFEVLVEKNVGPENGEPDAKWNNEKPHFNLYRPKDLSQGYCHPIVTWGNGTGDQPPTYEVLIKQLASHGFVVVASLSSQTAKGTPIPQIAGVNWMIQENDNPSSALYHHLDTTKIGATGHSQGGMATTMAGGDPRVTAIAPICGSRANIALHGPAILICGGADTMVPCSSVQSAFDSIKTVPVMMAEMAGTTHGSWIGSIKDPVMVATTGWMRVHLMNDTANRTWFYGANCKACTDSKWKIQRKMMDR